MKIEIRKLLPYLPKYYRNYYEANLFQFQKDMRNAASSLRIAGKTAFILICFYYLDRKYLRMGEFNLKTPNIVSRINASHTSHPLYDIPFHENYDDYEDYKGFYERIREAKKGNQYRYNMKYQDDPQQENGRFVDEMLFDSEYIRYRDLSRFQAMKQMQMVGFKEIKNENEINLRRSQLNNFKAKIKPVVE